MPTITTVRAALQTIAGHGVSHRSLYQLGSAMGPASLYVPGFATATGFEPLRRADSAGRPWLSAFTTPRPPFATPREDADLVYCSFTGAALLRLACGTRSGLVLDAGSPRECRLPLRAAESLQVAAGYTESLVQGTPVAAVPVRRRPQLVAQPHAS